MRWAQVPSAGANGPDAHHVGGATELLFASVASSVVERAHCPVAVIPTCAGQSR